MHPRASPFQPPHSEAFCPQPLPHPQALPLSQGPQRSGCARVGREPEGLPSASTIALPPARGRVCSGERDDLLGCVSEWLCLPGTRVGVCDPGVIPYQDPQQFWLPPPNLGVQPQPLLSGARAWESDPLKSLTAGERVCGRSALVLKYFFSPWLAPGLSSGGGKEGKEEPGLRQGLRE